MRPDHRWHLLLGLSIQAGTFALAERLGGDPWAWSVGATFGAAIGKEALDALGLGTPEWIDLTATLLGGFLGALVSWAASEFRWRDAGLR